MRRPFLSAGVLALCALATLGAPESSFPMEATEMPAVVDPVVMGYRVPVPEVTPNGIRVAYEAEGASCPGLCAELGGQWLAPAGHCRFFLGAAGVWDPACGPRFSRCPAGYQPSQSSANYGKCVLSVPGWADADQDPGRIPGEPDQCVGNPCDPSTGNKIQVEVDYLGNGPFPLRFERAYNSLDVPEPEGTAAPMGLNWRAGFDRRVVPFSAAGSSWAALCRGDGRQLLLRRAGAGWQGDPDSTLSLAGMPTEEWTVRNEHDEIERYSRSGRLLSITNRAGLTQTLIYDSLERPVTLRDAFGRSLTFTYDAAGRIASMTDPAGGVTHYAYDSRSRLASVTYPDDSTRSYRYNESGLSPATPRGLLTGIIDETGQRFATYRYDPRGKVISSEHAAGAGRVALAYPSETLTRVEDALGAQREYRFETIFGVKRNVAVSQPCAACSDGANVTRTTAYDAAGYVAQRTSFDGTLTRYTYDAARGLELSRTEAAGTPLERTIDTEWDERFRLPVRISGPGRELRLTYDDAGNVVARSLVDTVSGAVRTWRYAYDGNGQPTTATDPLGNVTTYTYHAADDPDPGRRGQLASSVNALGHETRYTAYDPHGNPIEIIDPNGLVVRLSYDSRGRLLQRDAGAEVTTVEYNATGQPARIVQPDGSALAFTYDAAQRLAAVGDSPGNRIAYTLDAVGNRIAEEVFDAGGTLAQRIARQFDVLDNLRAEIGASDPVRQITRYAYDDEGRPTSATDPFGATTTYEHDALRRLRRLLSPAAMAGQPRGEVRYEYDASDQLVAVTDPIGATTRYDLNGLGDRLAEHSPDAGATTSEYDAAGNLLRSIDARGVTARYSYDALNRVVRIDWAPPAGSTLQAASVTYRYDGGVNGKGRLTGFSDGTGDTEYEYDLHGRVTAEHRTVHAVRYSTRYLYDAAGRLSRMVYPSGRALDYAYDAAGRVLQIDTTLGQDTQVLASNVAYRPSGTLQRLVYGNGSLYTRRFDLDGRIVEHTLGAGSRTISYDVASRITGLTHSPPAVEQSFGHDALDRLTQWSAPTASQGYAYDANGNRTEVTYGSTRYGYQRVPGSNRLDTVAGPVARAYAYDEAGNLHSDGARSFVHDARGRLVQVTSGSTTVAYGINALGQRVSKNDRVFHYDQWGRLIGEGRADGSMLWEHVWLGSTPVAWITSDQDEDRVPDARDNCIGVPNANQHDVDGDGIGEACDGDVNSDGIVSEEDVLAIMRCARGSSTCSPEYDLSGNGAVTSYDGAVAHRRIGFAAGPSGLLGAAPAAQVF
jgi:YD repeat-containing protein